MKMSETTPSNPKFGFNMVAIISTVASLATASHQYQRAEQAEQIAQQRVKNIQEEIKREATGLQQQKIQNGLVKAEFDVNSIRNTDLEKKNKHANENIAELIQKEKLLSSQNIVFEENLRRKETQLNNNDLATKQTAACMQDITKVIAELSIKTVLKDSDKTKINELALCFSQGYTKKIEISASDATTERNSQPNKKLISVEKKAKFDEQIRLSNNLKPTVFIHIESGNQQLEKESVEIRRRLLEAGYIVPAVQLLNKTQMPKEASQVRYVYHEEKKKAYDLESNLKSINPLLFEQNKLRVTPPMERYRYDVAPNVLELWLIV